MAPLGRLWAITLPQVEADAHSLDDDVDPDLADDVDPDQDEAERQERAREVIEELADSRKRIAEVPAAQVIENHLIGLYELAGIHLAAGPEHMREAALAIDALGAVVEGLTGRLGDNEELLRGALQQIRLTFVQVKASHGQ